MADLGAFQPIMPRSRSGSRMPHSGGYPSPLPRPWRVDFRPSGEAPRRRRFSGSLPDPPAIDYRAATAHPAWLGGTIVADAIATYDFIVTGAGSAACAVAGRLSESGKYRVLLLEAGTRDSNPWIHIPLGYTRTFTDPRVNWMFDSEPEPQLNGRVLYQPRGKVLGGTSSINGMVYMRGTSTDYDGWRQRECEGWGYDDVLPYFRKAENQQRGEDEFHGVGGPLDVSNPARWD